MKLINEAYDVLSDPVSRKEYDEGRKRTHQAQSQYEEPEDSAASHFDQEFKEDWQFVVQYFPHVEKMRLELARYSSALALSFQARLLSNKSFSTADALRGEMVDQFLWQYFGSNPDIREFADRLIQSGQRPASKELNGLIRRAGTPSADDARAIIETICLKYNLDASYRGGSIGFLLGSRFLTGIIGRLRVPGGRAVGAAVVLIVLLAISREKAQQVHYPDPNSAPQTQLQQPQPASPASEVASSSRVEENGSSESAGVKVAEPTSNKPASSKMLATLARHEAAEWDGTSVGDHTDISVAKELVARLTIESDPSGFLQPTITMLAADSSPAIFKGQATTILSTYLQIVRLIPGSRYPQLLYSTFSGGAHCCFVTQVLVYEGGGWVNYSDELHGDTGFLGGDSAPPEAVDTDRDGKFEILSRDGAFNYTFGSHAGSFLPRRVYQIVDGKWADVSRKDAFRSVHEEDMRDARA